MQITDLIIMALATWRLSNFLANEDGPGGIGSTLRRWLWVGPEGQPKNWVGEAVICTWCNSVWIGAAVLILYGSVGPFGVYALCGPFALSGASILLGRLING